MEQSRVWVVVMMLILLKGWWCTDGCWEQERIALLQLKPFFNDPLSLRDWVEGEKTSDCCLWEGVVCNSTIGRIIQLDLGSARNKDLGEWYLNATLFLPFEKLKTLRLDDNQIADWVENKGFERLSSRLCNLEVLDLSFNFFNESILSFLGRFSSLKSLHIINNQLKGSIQIKDALCNLEELDISGTEIEKFVTPKDKGCLSKLKALYLSGMYGKKNIFLGFERLSLRLRNLEVLDLSFNFFNESILSLLGGFSSLKSLDICFNQLKGSIQIKDGLCNLEELDIDENEIEKFEAPKDKRCLSKLKVLRLTADITNKSIMLKSLELYTLTHLEGLYLEDSALQINSLQSLGALTSLKNLSLAYSEFNGTLTAHDLPNFKNLESLDLGNTTLNNSFLQTIGEMNSLKVLRLYESGLNDTLLLAQGLCKLIRLQELDITSNDFGGNLPECLANLTSLQSLYLNNNQFTGNLLEYLANLTSLQSLDLSSNQFTGNIAVSPLKSLTSIQSLSLSYNHFQIPISLLPFFNHSKLKSFDGSYNEIYAEIESHSLVPKFQLNEISLSGYGRGGAIPKFLYHQHDLQKVDLSHINLTGEFPNWLLENNTGLSILYLVNNSLSGPFHLPIHPHTILKELDISNNFFYGQIPADYGAYMPKLMTLNMSMNAFNDSIPSSLGDMNSLIVLDLSNNHLSGGIFSANFNLTNLQELQLDGNHFTGRIPDSLSNCSSLKVLDISNNHLSGKIPGWMGNMSYLEDIIIANNHLEGPIPMEFCKLDLKVIDLSNNNISGRMPSCFSPLNIYQVRLSKNRLQGPFPDAFYNSSSMVTLDLSNNHLIGSIPNWIHRVSQLRYLLLNNNDLEGEIPIQLCHLDQLSLIDLSHNNFFGRIPHCLNITTQSTLEEESAFLLIDGVHGSTSISTQEPVEFTTKNASYSYQGRILTYMSGIDLSCNKLTGKIPHEIGNLNKIHVLNLSHNSLSGPIPPTFANLGQIESLDLSNNNLSGKIPPELVELNFLAVFSVAHNNLSGKIPETAQFATFDNSSYEANPLLCGTPLSKSCSAAGPPSTMPRDSTDSEEKSGFIDMYIFYVSFTVTYIIVLLGIVAVLYINPYWRRVWFYHIEMLITSCYYFVVDNLPMRFRFGIM